MQEQLTNLLELQTYEHIYRDVVYFGEEAGFLRRDSRVLFSIDIRVRAGLDLREGFTITRDRSESDRVYVQLPAARILTVDADESTIHEYFIDDRSGRIGLLDLTGELETVKERVAEDAVERGILARAQSNARDMVREFLAVAGFAEVVFAPPAAPDPGEVQG